MDDKICVPISRKCKLIRKRAVPIDHRKTLLCLKHAVIASFCFILNPGAKKRVLLDTGQRKKWSLVINCDCITGRNESTNFLAEVLSLFNGECLMYGNALGAANANRNFN